MMEKEIAIFKIVEFSSIVILYKANGKDKMGTYISLEIQKNSMNIRFVAEGKSPDEVSVIIEYD
jgi:hypothetical protein